MAGTGSLESKTAVAGTDPDVFADFLFNLPGGPDPRPNLLELILEPGVFNADAFYFKNIVIEDVVKECFRCKGYRCVGADDINQTLDRLDVLLPRLLDLFSGIIATCEYPDS